MRAWLAAGVLAASTVQGARADTANFDDAAPDAQMAGWTLTATGRGKPKWSIKADPTAPSKPNVLEQSGQAEYPVALRTGTSIKDGFVETKFKAIAGSEDRAAGLVWRVRDANTYYVVRANALEDNIVLYKTVDGNRQELDIVGRKGGYGVNVPVPPNTWHTLRVEFSGTRFKVVYNGRPLFEVDDATLKDAGMVGVWTKEDSVTLFDDVSWGETK